MRILTLVCLIAFAASRSPAAAQTADPLGLPPVTLPPALDRVLRDYEDAWKGADGARLAAIFTEDGFTLSNGSVPIRGRAAIARWHTRSGGELTLRAFAWATSDSVGYIVGGYGYPGMTGPGGKFLLALRRGSDGKWLIAADMDNSAGRAQ
ncbi:MAG: nuclear transport factor 2 family protein [Gemmatimonadota bacterium]